MPLSYILKDLWPKLGFLPIDHENPGVALEAEFMLNELILKNSESLEKLNLQHLKELFSGEGDEDLDEDEEEGDYEMNDFDASEAMEALKQLKRQAQEENYKELQGMEDDDYSDEMEEEKESPKKKAKNDSKGER